MTYSRPGVQFAASALVAIQNQTQMNKTGILADRPDVVAEMGFTTNQESTASAYEADE